MRFGKVVNVMTGLRTEIVSLQDGPTHRGLDGRIHVRWSILYTNEIVAVNTDKETKNFDYEHGAVFW